jgi:hypothetical protein
MAVTTVHLFVRITYINGMGIRLLGQYSEFILLLSPEFYELVTKVAVFRQHGSIVAFMFAVMAAKAAQAVHVSALAREVLPAHLHDWVTVAIVKILQYDNNLFKLGLLRSGNVRMVLLIVLNNGILDAGFGRFP